VNWRGQPAFGQTGLWGSPRGFEIKAWKWKVVKVLMTRYAKVRHTARVRIEEIVDHLDSGMRKALADAVREVLPEVEFDLYALFRAFKRAVGRKCSTWENVPDRYVNAE
jgi:hypothetical protein